MVKWVLSSPDRSLHWPQYYRLRSKPKWGARKGCKRDRHADDMKYIHRPIKTKIMGSPMACHTRVERWSARCAAKTRHAAWRKLVVEHILCAQGLLLYSKWISDIARVVFCSLLVDLASFDCPFIVSLDVSLVRHALFSWELNECLPEGEWALPNSIVKKFLWCLGYCA